MQKNQLVTACMESWVVCENAMVVLPKIEHEKGADLVRAFNEFADICMGLLVALKLKSVNVGKLALLYIGLAEECVELCCSSSLPSLKISADTFRKSVAVISPIATF